MGSEEPIAETAGAAGAETPSAGVDGGVEASPAGAERAAEAGSAGAEEGRPAGTERPDESRRAEPDGHGAKGGDPDALRERVLDALKNVDDPELGINIVDLGLVYGVDFEGEKVHITYTLTTMGCPIGPMIEAEMKRFLDGVDGISEVEAEMVLRPPWNPDMMSEEAKAALGYF